MPEMDAARAWQHVRKVLMEVEGSAARLRPGASDAALDGLERLIGQRMPAEFRAVYRLHDGIEPSNKYGRTPLLSIADIESNWSMLESVFRDFTPDKKVKAAPGIAPVWWSRSWIPIQADGGGNHFSIDLAPRSGPAGRVIEFWHDDVDRKVLSKDFMAYVAREVDPQL